MMIFFNMLSFSKKYVIYFLFYMTFYTFMIFIPLCPTFYTFMPNSLVITAASPKKSVMMEFVQISKTKVIY